MPNYQFSSLHERPPASTLVAMNRKTLAIILLIVGVACAALALALRMPRLALAVFVVFGFIAGSLLSKAGRLADAISPMKGHRIYVSVWGTEIPGVLAGGIPA